MTVKEILEMESSKGPVPVLLLFREGIFLKAYEASAYLFHRFVKNYEVKAIYYKNINRSLLSIGFPSHRLDALVEEYGLACQPDEKNNAYRLTSGRFCFSEEEYQHFKEMHAAFSLSVSTKKAASSPPQSINRPETDILDRLRQFNLASSTPMECMLFLNELKLSLRG
jgi:hypothetical protein